MANRLQRIMAMDQMMQNRNMPQQGMQSVFNPTTGTFVNVPFQTDPNFKGRRTVMTPSGPQVLPGFQGQENPYRALGRGARNLLGNLFGRGQRRRQNRKADQSLQSQEEILRERYRQAGPDGQMNTDDDILPELVTKAATASPVVVKDGKGEITFTQERMPGVFKEAGSYENRIKQLMENQGINRGEAEQNQAEAIRKGMDLDNSGYVDDSEAFAFNNPTTSGQPLEIPAFRSGREEKLREIEERINRPILPSQNLPTFDVSQVRTPSTSEVNRKTTTFADGSALMIDTKGNARLLTKEGKEISQNDPKYAETLAKSIEQGIIQEGRLVFQKEEAKNRAKQLQDYSKSIPQAQRLVDNYEAVLKTIDDGASTGFIMSKLPSLRAASQRLDALQQELGLNVIANTTFGALSESELNFALRTALPTNLSPDKLKIEIQRRLEVQNKLIAYMMEAQNFIKGGGTVNGFLELKYDEQKAREKAQQNEGATTPPSNSYNPSNALTINTQKEFDALPSGTTYVDGQTGQVFRKP